MLSNDNATQAQVDAAKQAIEEAKAALDGAATNKEALREAATTDAQTTKTTDAKYYNSSSISKEDLKTSKNMLPNTGATETNTGLAGLGLAVLGSLLAVAKRRKKDEE